jgi:cbb3-type cytochrome oxidase maturation protein
MIGDLAQYWAAFFIGVAALGGIGGLFLWAWLSGQFRDVEAPARRVLEMDEETGVRS